jgi:hypothetical protein
MFSIISCPSDMCKYIYPRCEIYCSEVKCRIEEELVMGVIFVQHLLWGEQGGTQKLSFQVPLTERQRLK